MTESDVAALTALREAMKQYENSPENHGWHERPCTCLVLEAVSALIAAGLSKAPAFECAHGVAIDMWCNLCNRQLDALASPAPPKEPT